MAEELSLMQPAGADGELEGSIEWGDEADPHPVVVHAIRVPLAPLRLGEHAFDDEPVLQLHSIRFGVKSWRQLAGRTFSFPNVVRHITSDGESRPIYDIYGSLRMGAEYHQVLATGIAFGTYQGCRVEVNLSGSVNSVAHPPLFSPTDFSCDASLALGPILVRGDLGSSTLPDLAEAQEQAQRLLRLEDYEPPQDHNGRVLIRPTC